MAFRSHIRNEKRTNFLRNQIFVLFYAHIRTAVCNKKTSMRGNIWSFASIKTICLRQVGMILYFPSFLCGFMRQKDILVIAHTLKPCFRKSKRFQNFTVFRNMIVAIFMAAVDVVQAMFFRCTYKCSR